MFPILQLGPLAIQTPGLILLLGLWIGLGQMEKHAWRFNLASALLYNLVLIAIAAGLAGARLVYALRFPAAFQADPLSLLSPNPAMLDLQGGLLAAVLAALIYGQRKNMALWSTLDALTPALMVLAVALGAAHLASGEAFGAPTELPWGIELWGAVRHPTQVYEIVGSLLVALLLWPRGKPSRAAEMQAAAASGWLFWSFAALTAGLRVFIEAFRGDSVLILGQFRLAQLAAWVILGISLWQIGRRLKMQDQD